jgi:hypothetical protein
MRLIRIVTPRLSSGVSAAMYSTRTRNLLAAATLASGLLAGISIDRTVVTMPAWSQMGAISWADFSRHADLGNGLFLYPTEAILAALFACGSAVSWTLESNRRNLLAIQLYSAAALALGALLFTLKAAPVMMGIQHLNDPISLKRAFARFYFWGNLRAGCHVSAFAIELWALSRLSDQAVLKLVPNRPKTQQ